MQQHAAADSFADLPKTAPALRRGSEVEFAGVLHRQNMPAASRRRSLLAPALDQPSNRHLRIGKKAAKTNFVRSPAGQPANADMLARNHALEQRRPPLSRRRSPKRPNDKSACDSISDTPVKPKCPKQNHTNQPVGNPQPYL